jgi:hypothetical protein
VELKHLAAREPFPARCIAGIQDGVPVFIPVEEIGVFFEAIRKVVQAEPFINVGIGHIGLSNKF